MKRAAPRDPAAGPAYRPGVVDQLAEGLRYVRHTPRSSGHLVLGIVGTVALNFSVLMPLYAAQRCTVTPSTFGFLMAAARPRVAGRRAAHRLRDAADDAPARLRRRSSGSLVALALSSSLPVSLPIMAVLGFATIAMSATTNTLIQLQVPDALRGRVMSVYTTVFAGSTPIGGLASGISPPWPG